MTHSCLEESLLLDIGTASSAREYGLKDIPVAGKTGTHMNGTDLWFAGYSSRLTCAVWVGLDKKEPVYPDAFSRHTALPVWVDIMNAGAVKFEPEPLVQPEGMSQVELCDVSGELATESCLEAGPDPADPGRQKFIKCSYMEYIRPDSKLELRCTFHNKEDPANAVTAPVNPLALTSGPGGELASLDARPVTVTGPVIIGDDPYHSITGTYRDPAATPEGPDAAHADNGGTPPVIPAAPVRNPGNSQLLNPNPGKATVE